MPDDNNIGQQDEQLNSQDASFDPVMAEIIGDETGVDLTPKNDSEAQLKSQDPLSADESDKADYAITEEQLGELKDLGYEETDLDAIEPSDLKNILETKTAKPTQTGTVDTSKLIITQDMAERYGGIAKSFVGKPVDELLKAVEQNNKYVHRLEGELKQHQTKLTEKENQKVDELLNELKTSTDLSEEDFWKKHDELVKLQTRAQMQAETEKPQKEAEALAFMQEAMPEGINFKEAFNAWSQSLAPEAKQYYQNTNDYVIRDAVKTFIQLNQKDEALLAEQKRLAETEAQKESGAKILAAKKAAEAIKNSNGKRMAGSKYQVIQRGKNSNVSYDGLDPVVAEIIKNSLE